MSEQEPEPSEEEEGPDPEAAYWDELYQETLRDAELGPYRKEGENDDQG